MSFQVGDKIKWKLPRKGVVTEVSECYFSVMLGDSEWSFEHDQTGEFEMVEAVEPVVGSVAVDKHGDAVVRDEDGWRYGWVDSSTSFAWAWHELNEAYGPLRVVYIYVDTSGS